MNSKYYTPTIDEFHVGFECENFDFIEGNFKPFVIDVFRLHEILDHELEDYFEPTHYRVKFLDQQDIEDLGWILKGKSIDTWFYKEGTFDRGNYRIYKAELQYGFHDQRMRIFEHDGSDKNDIFVGYIKNKSEFKKVLEQLRLDKDLITKKNDN